MSSRSDVLAQGVGSQLMTEHVPAVENETNEPEKGNMQKIHIQQILDPYSSEGRKYQRQLMKNELGVRIFKAGLAPQFVTVDRVHYLLEEDFIVLTYTAWCKPYKVERR